MLRLPRPRIASTSGQRRHPRRSAHLSLEGLEVRLCLSKVSFGSATNWDAGHGPYSVAVGDFNNDGKDDLAVTNRSDGMVSVLINSGAGGFGTPKNYPVGTNPYAVAAGDLNGDGKLDLVVTNVDDNDVSVLIGSGTGEFASAIDFPVSGGFLYAIAVGDFNDDGKDDLAVTNSSKVTNGNSYVTVMISDGAGGFATPVDYPVGQEPISIAVADFNNDGKNDLAVANGGSNNISVLLGSGTGNFGTRPTVPVGLLPLFVGVGDFNNDGWDDLVVADWVSQGNPTVSVLLNDGTGEFVASIHLPVEDAPRSVAVGDFNGDGKDDLAVANWLDNSISVMINKGTAGFAAPIRLPVGETPFFVAVGDFDGNGKDDLVTANERSNNVSVLLNTTKRRFLIRIPPVLLKRPHWNFHRFRTVLRGSRHDLGYWR